MIVSEPWLTAAQAQLGSALTSHARLSGGDFAASYSASLGDGRQVFVKTHDQPPPGFFTTEAAGLNWLRQTGTVAIPDVLAVNDHPPLLVLQWIDQTHSVDESAQVHLGRTLAALHQADWARFGRPDECTTGSLALPNQPCDQWQEFYASQRLLPLVKIAHDREALPRATTKLLESLAHRLGDLDVPEEPPSLLHGDLWAGNRLADREGRSWLIDPAAHGGHREFDIAMMHLFGGFGPSCFNAYNDVNPLAPQWESRIALHQLAPLTVHAIKFAGPYPNSLLNALRQYV